jgi:hypothetical protein
LYEQLLEKLVEDVGDMFQPFGEEEVTRRRVGKPEYKVLLDNERVKLVKLLNSDSAIKFLMGMGLSITPDRNMNNFEAAQMYFNNILREGSIYYIESKIRGLKDARYVLLRNDRFKRLYLYGKREKLHEYEKGAAILHRLDISHKTVPEIPKEYFDKLSRTPEEIKKANRMMKWDGEKWVWVDTGEKV